jgi:ssDNA-binding Zn-finger/Zn-ribbon topoisomerase 1
MARLTFGRCRPKPGQPCPLCGKPVMAVAGRSILTGFALRDWIVCSGAPACDYARLCSEGERRRAAS